MCTTRSNITKSSMLTEIEGTLQSTLYISLTKHLPAGNSKFASRKVVSSQAKIKRRDCRLGVRRTSHTGLSSIHPLILQNRCGKYIAGVSHLSGNGMSFVARKCHQVHVGRSTEHYLDRRKEWRPFNRISILLFSIDDSQVSSMEDSTVA